MASDITAGRTTPPYISSGATESAFSGVSWAAIIAGGVAAAAMAIILATLGAGLGLVAISPWPGHGASLQTVSIGIVIWSIVIEVAAFGIGGYLAGRLRTKWANVHTDEVFFRDTAHGFVTWALGTLVSIAIISSAAGTIARGGAELGAAGAAAAAAGGAGAGAGMMAMGEGPSQPMPGGPNGMPAPHFGGNPMDYYIDTLFRPAGTAQPAAGGTTTDNSATNNSTTTTTTTNGAPANGQPAGQPGATPNGDLGPLRGEIGRILMVSFKDGQLTLSNDDRNYIAGLISQRTGLSPQDAQKRVDDTVTQVKNALAEVEGKAKQAADDARKAGAGLALWSFIAMLIGAFAASYAATLGGRLRDR